MELSFKNDPEIKSKLVLRMDKHIELDELVKGATGQGGKGCTVWCALNNGDINHGYNHAAFPDVLGLPEWLARLQDTLFENLPEEDAKIFSASWVKVIPVGKNIEPVRWKFAAFIMKENIERVLLLDIDEALKKRVVDAISGVVAVHNSAIDSGVWDESAARSAAESAGSAAWSAAGSAGSAAWSARSAAESAGSAARSAESAAWSAAGSAGSAARSAAESAGSAAESAAGSAAWSAAFKRYADHLLELLSNA